ncbi:hypothetical protein KQH62_01175 [bacterium]|nr:hypothetical protein [bacterium]
MNSKKTTKNILISCAVIIVVACLCLGLLAVTGVGVSIIWPLRVEESETSMPSAATEPVGTLEEAEGDFPSELLAAVEQIETQVRELRGLDPNDSFDRELISEAELEKIVAEDFFAEYTDEDARMDVVVLSTLGLLPPDFNLKELYTDLYSEQIAGFYDDEVKTMYVVQGTGFGGSEKLTYAHEFTHVLQDQVWGFEDGLDMSEEACEADSERCAAIQALVEGDASTLELLWFQNYATRQDYEDLMQTFEEYESPILDSAPPFMASDLYFPYEKGQAFVQMLYDDGGFDRVDEAFDNLPVSTEQILHPERYPDDRPIPVSLPDLTDTLGAGWSLYDQNVMGEWYTYLILNQAYEADLRLSESFASTAAEGWGGDAYAFYINDETGEVVYVLDSVWDTSDDALEFSDAFHSYADARWTMDEGKAGDVTVWEGGGDSISFLLDGSRTVWIIAPDSALAERVMNSLR